MRFVRTFLLAIAVVTLPFAAAIAQEQPPLTPQAILQMKQIGLSDAIILSTIKAQPGRIPYTVDDLAAMKKAEISDAVISAMVSHTDAPPPPAVQAVPSPPPTSIAAAQNEPRIVEEIGVYYKDHSDTWTPMPPEILTFRSGGALKSTFTNNIVKKDMNGHVFGEHAKLRFALPLTLLIYTTDGVAPAEYQMIRFRVHENRREFRTQTGGVFHSTTGADRDVVQFDSKKVANHTYEITLPQGVGRGEYGLLPPGAVTSSNAASAGKIYTFSIME